MKLLLALALFTSIGLLFFSEYQILSVVFVPLVLAILHNSYRDCQGVTCLIVGSGAWQLCLKGQWISVELSRDAVLLPLCVHIDWRESGGMREGTLYLFRDSMGPAQWRRLRARLNLARQGGG